MDNVSLDACQECSQEVKESRSYGGGFSLRGRIDRTIGGEMTIFGSMQAAFLAGASRGATSAAGMIASGNAARVSYDQLYAKAISGIKSGLDVKDLRNLEIMLRKFEPEMLAKFKKDSTKLGDEARKAVNKSFRDLNSKGPLGPPKRKNRTFDKMYTQNGRDQNRLSWAESRSKRNSVDVNYKSRTPASVKKGMMSTDKTISVIRVRVRGAAYVLADMAKAGGRARKSNGTMSRPYMINRYGRGVVPGQHRISEKNVTNWLSALNNQGGSPSRYAWPAFVKHAPKYQAEFSGILNNIVSETNRRLSR
jgi:hypothetical protein